MSALWDRVVTYVAYAAVVLGLCSVAVFFSTIGIPSGQSITLGVFLAFVGALLFYIAARLYNEGRSGYSQRVFWRSHRVNEETQRIACQRHHCEMDGRFPEDADVRERLTTWGYER